MKVGSSSVAAHSPKWPSVPTWSAEDCDELNADLGNMPT